MKKAPILYEKKYPLVYELIDDEFDTQYEPDEHAQDVHNIMKFVITPLHI